eukprot:CAMPEP_0172485718 /NCGR_PEP_ID=MMETSP1066-20121228/13867_1 /TAXON_ID=671091 /ORGANISM="Coscinodiscus wailesii, Strain CCMP2513" /LENGTH=987 /DNA_ID=CAMNT_0013251149 /DNA_START=47 /DNA_END=3010 /DNA_ORIENTATION=-
MPKPGEGPFVPGQEPFVPNREPFVVNQEPYVPGQEPYVPGQEPYVPGQGSVAPNHDRALPERNSVNPPSERMSRTIPRSLDHAVNSNKSFRVSHRKTASSIREHGWLDDDPADMTLSRRIALYLSEFNWYFPKKENDENAPDLAVAWAFFEHVTLPRYFVRSEDDEINSRAVEKDKARRMFFDEFEKAPAGEYEAQTSLYPFFRTPEDQMADFGIGVGLYFNTLKVVALICLIAGLINIPSMMYYNSSEYSTTRLGEEAHWSMTGSAVCTNQTWAPCPGCTKDDWIGPFESKNRYTEVDGRKFIKTNQCFVGFEPGFENWISLLFIFVSLVIMAYFQRKKETQFDLIQQTASDYSVEVENPPKDASDLEEWKDFFSQFGAVALVTVARHNEDLIKALVKRRQLMLQFESLLPPELEMDPAKIEELARSVPQRPLWKRILCCCCGDIHKVLINISKTDEEIKDLVQQDYDVSNVFVTFEKETDQRRALQHLSIRKIDMWMNNTDAIDDNCVFRGNHVLSIREPYEPSSIRWDDLNSTLRQKVRQGIITFIFTFAYIALNGWLIIRTKQEQSDPLRISIIITILNFIGPMVIKIVEDLFERHSDEGSKQASRYIKITLLRWVNTVIVVALATPFTATLNPKSDRDNLLYPVYAIFMTEMIKSPIFQIGDPFGNVYRHILGPRKPDQRRMNLCFTGGGYEISERYTDATKVMFMTFFYGTLFPAAYFFACATLIVHYLTDKWCLLRIWRQQPAVGVQISRFSRSYFFTAALLAGVVSASYWYSGFPFSNACKLDSTATTFYQGTYNNAKDLNGDSIAPFEIYPWTPNYQFCDQNLWDKGAFPALPRGQDPLKWMSEGQERICRFYGWTSIAILALVCCIYIQKGLVGSIVRIFFKVYEPEGDAEGTTFSNCRDIEAYIPEIRVSQIPFPLLACDISDIDTQFLGWEDPDRSFEFYNLLNDMERFLEDKEITGGQVNFSTVKYWPPEESGT